MIRQKTTIFSLFLVLMMLSSCGFSSVKSSDFLAVPEIASEFKQLQSEIDKALGVDGEYAAPISGSRRQSVQLEDLDKNGTKEAIVFMRTASEKPLKLCLFVLADGIYTLKASVEGEGSFFDCVYYYDVDGDGYSEIIVGRSLGSGVPKAVSVYSVSDDGFFEMMSNTYTGISLFDMDDDGVSELVIVRHDLSSLTGVAEVYSYSESDKAMLLADSVSLSSGADSILRIKSGYLSGMRPAIFISSQYNKTDILTDICAYRNGKFVNISMNEEMGFSAEEVKQYTIFGSDINGDKIFDLPMVGTLPSYETQKSSETFRKIVWRNYNLYGRVTEVMQTYHNNSDGWYFILPEQWYDNLYIDRRDYVSGERTIVFSVLPEGETIPVDVLSIYTLTGDNKEDRSRLPGRFRIITEQTKSLRRDTIFAAYLAELPPELADYAISEEDVIKSFRLIQTEWLTGELNS
ncbi:MAG: FG-GAP repeat domain-containing protein [Eubacteriales bacterium]|jgi:hypothetical protein